MNIMVYHQEQYRKRYVILGIALVRVVEIVSFAISVHI